MVHEVINRENPQDIDRTFCFWNVRPFSNLKKLVWWRVFKEDKPAEELQQHSKETPQEHYKLMVTIPLLGSPVNQLEDRFEGEGRLSHILLCLVPSVLLSKSCSLQLSDN